RADQRGGRRCWFRPSRRLGQPRRRSLLGLKRRPDATPPIHCGPIAFPAPTRYHHPPLLAVHRHLRVSKGPRRIPEQLGRSHPSPARASRSCRTRSEAGRECLRLPTSPTPDPSFTLRRSPPRRLPAPPGGHGRTRGGIPRARPPSTADSPGNVVQGLDVEISRTGTHSAAPPGLANLASCTNLADLASFALAASARLRDATCMARTDDPIAGLLADFEKGDEDARAKLF